MYIRINSGSVYIVCIGPIYYVVYISEFVAIIMVLINSRIFPLQFMRVMFCIHGKLYLFISCALYIHAHMHFC